jgi:hypothetical protein
VHGSGQPLEDEQDGEVWNMLLREMMVFTYRDSRGSY